MKTYHFYTLHEFAYPDSDAYSELDYIDSIRKAVKNKDALLMTLANDLRKSTIKRDEKYLLDNGHDARFFRYTGAIMQVSEDAYNRIADDEVDILCRKSEKSRRLMSEYKIIGWHRPFKISATDAEHFWQQLEKIFGYRPAIEFSSTVENPVLY